MISVNKRDLIFTMLGKGYVDAAAAHVTAVEQFMKDCDLKFRILDEPLQNVGLGMAFQLDEDGTVQTFCDTAGIDVNELLSLSETASLVDVATFPEKTYAFRINHDDYCVDVAAVSRTDAPGIIVGYYYTSPEYTRIYNDALSTLVSEYSMNGDGTIVVSTGNKIVASNDPQLIGKNIEDIAILRQLMNKNSEGKLIHAKDEHTAISYSFGLMEKSRDYYIYAFMSEHSVFDSTPKNMLYTLLVYLIAIIALHVMRWRMKQSYQKKELIAQQKYTESLEKRTPSLGKPHSRRKRRTPQRACSCRE